MPIFGYYLGFCPQFIEKSFIGLFTATTRIGGRVCHNAFEHFI